VLGALPKVTFCTLDEEGLQKSMVTLDVSKVAKAVHHHAGDSLPKTKSVGIDAPFYYSEANINPKFTFDHYVVGLNSSYSVAVAKAVAEKPGKIYNPLFFYGPTGLGKTHLMQAIGYEVMQRKKKAVVRYVTSEQFINDFVEAIKTQTFSAFRARYRKVDVLLLDDVQFFSGKESMQEEFFHTFNELFNNGKQIVLASDRPPLEIKGLEQRLVSRFQWGMTTQVQVPDFETRIAILQKKQADFHIILDSWIIEFMANHLRNNIRKLEGALMRVATRISLEGKFNTEQELAHFLVDMIEEEPTKMVTIDRIQRTVANHFDLRVSDLTGQRRVKNISEARHIAMYLTRELVKLPLKQIGEEFGGRDHGTVIHACKTVVSKVKLTVDYKITLDQLSQKILSE
jgi:chromosomal replication initiator protein